MSFSDTSQQYELDIVSATWGSADVTQYLRSQFNAVKPSKTWSFRATSDFFRQDPHVGLVKACVVIYRLTLATDSGTIKSGFIASTALEGSDCSLDFASTDVPVWDQPRPSGRRQFIFAAHWLDQDVTAKVQSIFSASTASVHQGIPISGSGLHDDSSDGHSTGQLSITYGSKTPFGDWVFRVATGQQEVGTNLNVTVPPAKVNVTSFLTVKNAIESGLIVTPLLFDMEQNLYWDPSQDWKSGISKGESRDIMLKAHAKCLEGQSYYLGFRYGTDSTWCDTSLIVTATSMSVGTPVTYSCEGDIGDQKSSYKIEDIDRACESYPADYRLSIYSATWGSTDYTSFVQQKYISQAIEEGSTDFPKLWQFIPSTESLGPDPNPGVTKAFVVVYRVAVLVGVENGNLLDPNAPAIWTDEWAQQKPPMLPTTQYPILRPVSRFRTLVCLDGSSVFTDPKQQDLTPYTWPDDTRSPVLFKAVYYNTDVTETVHSQLSWGPAGATVQVDNNARLGLEDPMPGTPKQLTMTIGWPLPNGRYTVRTLLSMSDQESSQVTTIPLGPPAFAVEGPIPKLAPTYKEIRFTNNMPHTCWPKIWQGDTIVWDSFKQVDPNKWKLQIGQTLTLDLFADAGCTEGQTYQFSCDPQPAEVTHTAIAGLHIKALAPWAPEHTQQRSSQWQASKDPNYTSVNTGHDGSGGGADNGNGWAAEHPGLAWAWAFVRGVISMSRSVSMIPL